MSTLLRTIVDDIVEDLKQTLDDKTIQPIQIGYWIVLIGNRLKSQHIGKRDSGSFLSVYDDVPVEKKSASKLPNEIKERKFIRLPRSIYDYDKDGGIEYISYCLEEPQEGCPPPFTNVLFNRTTPSKSGRLYFSKYEEPSPARPYFYVVHDYIYLLGIECVDIKSLEIGIYSTLDPITEIDLDAPFDFPDELLAILKRQVIDLGRFSLLMPEEKINDGANRLAGGGIPTNKIVSVNELDEDQIENK